MAATLNHCRRFGTTVFALLLLIGCAAEPAVPLASLSYQNNDAGRQRNLLVLLRGFGEDNSIFDVIAPDLHFGYYQAQTVETRLKEDIIEPARRQGYKRIWLAGFSMGGLGCLSYQRKYPGDIDGILLTSPFLGWQSIHREIRRAGGVSAWTGTSDDMNDWEMLWTWIKNHDASMPPPIWLGYSDSDILTADGPPLYATVLPAERVFTIPDNHDIKTFRAIFLRHLDTLARESAATVSHN